MLTDNLDRNSLIFLLNSCFRIFLTDTALPPPPLTDKTCYKFWIEFIDGPLAPYESITIKHFL